MNLDFKTLLKTIEDADVITLFRHTHPDCDALSSQNGMYSWIKTNFPNKRVYRLGEETTDQTVYPPSDKVDEDTIRSSTAIILDTGNKERIDDQRYALAKQVIKIDHHPNLDPYGTQNYVCEEAAATCEILTSFFASCDNQIMNHEIATYLYKGLLTDTLCFRTSNTTQHTLEMAAKLASYNLAIPELNRELFDVSYKTFHFSNWIRSNAQLLGEHLAYVIIPVSIQNEYNISASSARNRIDEIGHVKEFTIWAIFTEKIVNGQKLYDGSLRSKTAIINTIANKYHGGGHNNASGVKDLTENDLQHLLEDLYKLTI